MLNKQQNLLTVWNRLSWDTKVQGFWQLASVDELFFSTTGSFATFTKHNGDSSICVEESKIQKSFFNEDSCTPSVSVMYRARQKQTMSYK